MNGEVCEHDVHCKVGSFCWYNNAADKTSSTKKCLEMYGKDFGAEFGWSSADWENPTHDDLRHNGKFCNGGIAFPKDADTARCSLTDNIQFE